MTGLGEAGGVLSGGAAPAQALRDRLRRGGPITFADYQTFALDAFFAHGRGAGRAGRDFVTSPEVGSLYGTLLARALDAAWERLGTPDPFVLIDAGGGRGRLLTDVLRADPTCAPALRAVLVERSAQLRREARTVLPIEPPDVALGPFAPGSPDEAPEPVPGSGPVVTLLDDLPEFPLTGVIVANELLDNLAVRIVERLDDRWAEVRVGLADDDRGLVEVLVDAPADLAAEADVVVASATPTVGDRLPIPVGAAAWLTRTAAVLRHGELWLVDYGDDAAGLLARGPTGPAGWLRTYRAHGRGTGPLDQPGDQDVTTDLPLEWLRHAARRAGFTLTRDTTQDEWLHSLDVDALVEAGRRRWAARAHVGDLDAIAARSRGIEAAALTDPHGLGAHRVLVLTRG